MIMGGRTAGVRRPWVVLIVHRFLIFRPAEFVRFGMDDHSLTLYSDI